jgi:hypothetical protein
MRDCDEARIDLESRLLEIIEPVILGGPAASR